MPAQPPVIRCLDIRGITSRCEREEVNGSEKQTYAKSSSATRTSYAPKKRGEKARTKRK